MQKYNGLNYSDDFHVCYGVDDKDRNNITKAVFHKETRTIEAESFLYCTNLKEIIADCNLFYIKLNAFLGCTNLEKVFLNSPNTIKLEVDAFYGCGQINNFETSDIIFTSSIGFQDIKFNVKNLTINFSFKNDFPFSLFASDCKNNCPIYEHITLNIKNKILKDKTFKDFICYPDEQETLFYYPPQNKEKIITVPENIENIDSYCFEYNPYIEEIHLGKNIKFLGTAFCNLDNLKNIYINSDNLSLKGKLKNLFSDCPNLENIYLTPKAFNKNSKNCMLPSIFKPMTLEVLIDQGKSFKEINNIYKKDKDNER